MLVEDLHVDADGGKLKEHVRRYDRITTTIEREWLAEIVAGTKKIEYRQIKPYWTKRFATSRCHSNCGCSTG
jgi:hypothetical protein